MTDLENYSFLINSVFGAGTTTFDISKNTTNNVLGALNDAEGYLDFRLNFNARVRRLHEIYKDHPTYLTEVIKQFNLIADNKNWQGAFAELAAYDHLNGDLLRFKAFIQEPIQPNVTLPSRRSFAHDLGKQETNVDGYLDDLNLYLDVKCLKDNVNEILQGIYVELKRNLAFEDFLISAEYDLHLSYEDFQKRRKQLLDELKLGINLKDKPTYVQSRIIPHLNYRIRWGSGISFSERSYQPFEHAKNLHSTIFNYANKFIKDSPFVIVLVVFPWYNLVISDFADSNKRFYRAFARRVFCQYLHNNVLFSSYDSSFQGSETMHEISRFLSGIIFLEDDTILSKDPTVSNVKSFVYYNPNAINPIPRTQIRSYLAYLRNSDFDDFEFDNY